TKGVLPGPHHLLVGGPERAALVPVIALGPLEDLPAMLLRSDGALHPCHDLFLSSVASGSALAQQALDLLDVTGVDIDVALEASRPRRRLLLEQVLAHGLLAPQLPAACLLEPFGRGAARLHLGHLCSSFVVHGGHAWLVWRRPRATAGRRRSAAFGEWRLRRRGVRW